MYALYTEIRDGVRVLHVNGHVGVEGNELADRMSIHGIATKEETLARFEIPAKVAEVLKMRAG